jgi:HK97 family phage major capsid protein
MDNNDVLNRLDGKLDELIENDVELKNRVGDLEKAQAGSDKLSKKLAEMDGKFNKVENALKAADDTIVSVKDAHEQLETELRSKRFGLSGLDSLIEAIPDDQRKFIVQVEGNPGDERLSKAFMDDPVKRVAISSWFHSTIRQKVAAMQGDQLKSNMYFERCAKLERALGGGVTKANLQESTDVAGGYLVPAITEAVIGRLISDYGAIRQAGPTMIQMSSKTHYLPTLANNFTATLTAEAGTISDSAPTTMLGQSTLTAKKFTGLATVSLELLEDNIVNLSDFILSHMAERIARLEDAQALEGDGTGSSFSGLYTITGCSTLASGDTYGTNLTMAALVKTIYKAEEAHSRQNAKFFVHPWVLRDASMLTSGTTTPLGGGYGPWLPFIWNNGLAGANLLGFPAISTTAIARNRGTSSNEAYIYFGNTSGIVIGDRSGTRFDVDPYGLFTAAQIRLRIIKRTGIVVWVPSMFCRTTGYSFT